MDRVMRLKNGMVLQLKNVIKAFFYFIYVKRLELKSHSWKIPYHIGIILDGNRRFAREQGYMDVTKGHEKGADKLEEVLTWCETLGVKIVSIWVFSLDNFKRDQSEVTSILALIEKKMRDLINKDTVHSSGIKIRSMGRIDLLPEGLQSAIHDAEEATKDYDRFVLNIAVAYGGREEIIEAFRKHIYQELENNKNIRHVIDELSVEKIRPHLYTSDLPDPDLIIRTSGEIRLSGFLLWQSAFSEYYFCDTFWPTFRKIDLLRAVRDYNNRQRRFGR